MWTNPPARKHEVVGMRYTIVDEFILANYCIFITGYMQIGCNNCDNYNSKEIYYDRAPCMIAKELLKLRPLV